MRNNTTKLFWLASFALLTGACTADVGSETSNLTSSSSRSKTLAQPFAVPADNDIGKDIDVLLASVSEGLEAYRTDTFKWGDTTCTSSYYGVEGWRYVNFDDCEGDSRILRAYADGNRPVVVWADHDYDGRIDSWSHNNVDGNDNRHNLHDYDYDGRVDNEAVSFALLVDFEIQGYGDCDAPTTPAMRILEDTNSDGMFDTESVTGGRDADGNYSWWLCR